MVRITVIFFMLLAACASETTTTESTDPEESAEPIDLLLEYMTGRFDSRAQAEVDTNYLNISLIMEPIWEERTDGHWLYVEQALASMLENPYRQRVYHVYQDGDRFVSEVYTLPYPDSAIGAWNHVEPLAEISPEDLMIREGCAVFLDYDKEAKAFNGGTNEQDCSSDLFGASYATSEISIDALAVTSWDRGWDSTSSHVWGAKDGPYIFKRVADLEN